MKIYQIFYNQETKEMLDPQFIPFDNTNPSEPSWFEFESIKKILESNVFDDNEFVGIFSPRFFEKTGFTGSDVIEIVGKSKSEIINFSPDLKASISYLNCFIQAESKHPGFISVAQKAYKIIGLDLDLSELISNHSRTIFSNYFVAKYSFWKVWFKYALRLYFLSANQSNLICKKLNALTRHRGVETYPMKVFIMERLINVVLENEKIDSEIGLNYEKYYSLKGYSGEKVKEMFIIDELKSLMKNGDKALLRLYFEKIAVYRYL